MVKDDESTPAVAVKAANELVRDDVAAVMGGYASSVTLAVQSVTARAGKLYFVAGSQTSKMFGDVDPNALRINTNSEVAGYSAAEYLLKDVGAKRIGVLWENDAYGQDALAQFESSVKEIGGATIVASEQFAFTDTDFRVGIGNVKAARPDVVVTFSSAAITGLPVLMKQLKNARLSSKLFAGFGTVMPKTIELAEGDADGWESADIYYPQSPPFTTYRANVDFVKRYQEIADGLAPDRWAALPAQSLIVWAKAVGDTKSTAADTIADAIKGGTFSDTILGDVAFTEQGQMTAKVQVYSIKDSAVVPVLPIEVPQEFWRVTAQ